MKTILDFLIDNIYFVYFAFSVLLIHYFTIIKEIKNRYYYLFSYFLAFYGIHYFFKSLYILNVEYTKLPSDIFLLISVYFLYLFISDKLLKQNANIHILFFIIASFFTVKSNQIISFVPFLISVAFLLMIPVMKKRYKLNKEQKNNLITFSVLFIITSYSFIAEYFFVTSLVEISRILLSLILMGLIMFSLSGFILFKKKGDFKKYLFIFIYFSSLIIILCSAAFIIKKIQKHIKYITKKEIHQIHTSISTRLELEFSESEKLVSVLANTKRIKDYIKDPTSEKLKIVQEVLDDYSNNIDESVVYLMDSSGNTLDASNRNSKDSLVGKNYSFRPYFKEAIVEGKSKYLAVGITTGKRGFYSSKKIIDKNNKTLGVAVIKRNIDYIEFYLQNYTGPVFLTDPDGIIFMSNINEVLFHPLDDSLNKEDISNLLLSRKYPIINKENILSKPLNSMKEIKFLDKNYFYTERLLKNNWKIVCLISSDSMYNYIKLFLTTVLFIEILIILFFNTYQKEKLYIEKILQSEDRYRSIFDNSPNIIALLDDDFNIIHFNRKAKQLVKNSDLSLLMGDFSVFLGKDAKRLKNEITKTVSKGNIFSRELIFSTAQGKRIMFSLFSKLHDSRVMFIGIDITEERRMEKELFEEKERLLVTLNSMEEFVVSTTREGQITLCNQAFSELIGISEKNLINKYLKDIIIIKVDDTEIDIIKKARDDKYSFSIDSIVETGNHFFKASCKLSPVFNNYGYISNFVLVFRDVSKEQKIEEEMIEIQKIESIGLFAAGIAHDFNNILTSILGNISMASKNNKNDSDTLKLLENAENACSNARELTNQLLEFTKDKDFEKSVIDIKELLIKNANFSVRGNTTRLSFDIKDDLWNVVADPGQINQVINNIIMNAIQSSEKTVKLNILASNYKIKESISKVRKTGDYVKINIKDNGPGIKPENVKKIFDPYFTTKKDGTGLGLATVRSILKKHDGFIDVLSDPGEGTEFIIYLPASKKELFKVQKDTIVEKKETESHNGTILVMDDEEDVREITGMMLEEMGYEAAYATKGEEVIELIKKGKRYDLIIIDLTIRGGLGGIETLKIIKKIDPGIKTIVSSGYSQNISGEDFKSQGFDGSLSKPFTYDEIYKAVEKVLN